MSASTRLFTDTSTSVPKRSSSAPSPAVRAQGSEGEAEEEENEEEEEEASTRARGVRAKRWRGNQERNPRWSGECNILCGVVYTVRVYLGRTAVGSVRCRLVNGQR